MVFDLKCLFVGLQFIFATSSQVHFLVASLLRVDMLKLQSCITVFTRWLMVQVIYSSVRFSIPNRGMSPQFLFCKYYWSCMTRCIPANESRRVCMWLTWGCSYSATQFPQWNSSSFPNGSSVLSLRWDVQENSSHNPFVTSGRRFYWDIPSEVSISGCCFFPKWGSLTSQQCYPQCGLSRILFI